MRYTFDAQGRLKSIATRNNQTANFAYDGGGRLTTFTGPTPASRVATFAYDGSNRLTSIDYAGGLMHVALVYDAAGNLTGYTNAIGQGISKQVDAMGRLTMHTDATGVSSSVTYTATGAIDKVTTPTGDVALTYDAMGRTNTNGTADALTDGLLIVSYLFNLRGSALIAGAVDPLGIRKSAVDIETYLATLMP